MIAMRIVSRIIMKMAWSTRMTYQISLQTMELTNVPNPKTLESLLFRYFYQMIQAKVDASDEAAAAPTIVSAGIRWVCL